VRGNPCSERETVASSASCGTVLIADENGTSREELVGLFEAAGYEVMSVSSGEEALRVAGEVELSIVLLEISLGSMSGYEVCRALRERTTDLPIVFVSGSRTESYDRVAGLLLGADDYVVKPYAPDELLTRVRILVRRSQTATQPISKLTKREREVLQLLSEGLRQDEIAERLFITRRTVGTHVENILRKLGVRSQTQAVALAFREELLDVMS
jgi:DNA-binding NarL/FixJ family response regulator